ncbi:hypothetical protein [Nostoc sp. FACHB-152]|nr:hypothetical protein [Nostoc sp. FACHB-152]
MAMFLTASAVHLYCSVEVWEVRSLHKKSLGVEAYKPLVLS